MKHCNQLFSLKCTNINAETQKYDKRQWDSSPKLNNATVKKEKNILIIMKCMKFQKEN
jgi:hypothetical protein